MQAMNVVCPLKKYNDIKEGDQIETFIMEEVPR